MANNYCESSSMISIPKDKVEQAKEIMARIASELESDSEEGYVGYEADLEADGVWIHHGESINTEHAETLVRALVEELDLTGIFVCSWSYTCSKPRIDEFGGGAFAIQKGRDTIWVDAALEALRQASISETNDERMHPYQRERTSITGLGLKLRKIIETGRLVGVVMTRLVLPL